MSIRTLKVLSLLLAYPTAEIAAAAPAFAAALDEEGLVPARGREALRRLAAELGAGATSTTWRSATCSCSTGPAHSRFNLFEHVHGESRDRGQAMVELKELYAANGLEMPANELPDYLPLFLEFLSTRPLAEARGYLADAVHIVSALKVRLERRRSIYAAVFAGLEHLAGTKAAGDDLDALLERPDDDADDTEALDRVWEEEPVTFGPGPNAAAPCGPDRLAAQVRAGRRPPPPAAPDTTGG